MTTQQIQQLLNGIIDKAVNDGGKSIAAAVCDAEGFLIGFVKMQGAPTRVGRLAQLKAYTAARMQAPTAAFAERLKREGIELAYFCDPQLTAFPGGAPIIRDGTVIGSIGISGRTSEEDQELALQYAKLIAAQ